MAVARIGLCKGRHEISDGGEVVDTFIFQEAIADPHDFTRMTKESFNFFENLLTDTGLEESSEIHLFVTGLTSALISTLKAYEDFPYAPKLVLRHFNRDTNEYTIQDWR